MTRAGREVRVVRYPDGAVTPEDFEVVEVPVGEPGPGQVLVRNTWTSVDPGVRLRLRAVVHRETVFSGLDSAPRALAAMIAGDTAGKTLVSIG